MQLPIPQTAALAGFTAGMALLPDLDKCGSSPARSLGFVSEAVAWVFGRISGGHRHATHSFLGIAVFTALAWVSCHFRADWGGKAGLALLMTLSVSAALEALHLARGHVADLAGVAVAAAEIWYGYGLRFIPIAVLLGCATHITGDMLTDSGCMLGYPWSRQRFHLLPEPLAFTTGTLPELLIIDPILSGALLALAVWIIDPVWLRRPVGSAGRIAARSWPVILRCSEGRARVPFPSSLEAGMWHAMFVEQIPFTEKILRTVLVYALIAVLFRLSGKRGLANLSTFDFVVIFLLSNVVQNAVIGNDTSLTGGVVGAVTLVTVNAVVNRVVASSALAARIFDGRPTTVIRDGHVIQRALMHLGVRRSELDHAVRMQNGDGVSDIQDGVLEPGGQLVLNLKSADQSATHADIAQLRTQLSRIEDLLRAAS